VPEAVREALLACARKGGVGDGAELAAVGVACWEWLVAGERPIVTEAAEAYDDAERARRGIAALLAGVQS